MSLYWAVGLFAALFLWSLWSSVRAHREVRARLASKEKRYERGPFPATVTTRAPISYRLNWTTLELVITDEDAVLLRHPAFRAPPIALLRPGETAPGCVPFALVGPPEVAGDEVTLRSDPARFVKTTVSFRVSDPVALVRALEAFRTRGRAG